MEKVFASSLALVDELFESVTEEEFVKEYLACEKHVGPKARDYLLGEYGPSYGLVFQVSSSAVDALNKHELSYKSFFSCDEMIGQSSIFSEAINDSSYGIAA